MSAHAPRRADGRPTRSGLYVYMDPLFDDTSRDLNERRVELRARTALYLCKRLWHAAGSAVGTIAGDRIQGVRERYHPGAERDGLSFETSRVAIAIPALMVVSHERPESGKRARSLYDRSPKSRMCHHDSPLLFIESARLAEDAVGNSDLSKIVQQARCCDQIEFLARESGPLPEGACETRHALGMSAKSVLPGIANLDKHL